MSPPAVPLRAVPAPATSAPRVMSIDALRGFDMFWIMGGDMLAQRILGRLGPGWPEAVAGQFEHVDWEGFHFQDLIFPLFLFLVGCVLPFSLEKYRGRPGAIAWRIVRRTAVLVLLGLVYNSLLSFAWPIRALGVLQRIGICYGLAAAVFLGTSLRGRAAVVVGLLLGWWALLAVVPAPGSVAGPFTPEGNISGWVDRSVLPGRILEKYYGFGDNEGLLSTLGALATTLLGTFAGDWLRGRATPWGRVAGLALAGAACVAGGWAWSPWLPVIKNLWTSSFVLVSGGWCLLLLALFHAVVDVLGWGRPLFFFTVIGANAITIYIAQRCVDFNRTAEFFFGGLAELAGDWSGVVLGLGLIAVKWAFLLFLWRHKVFLRV
jgi:predicted acyltransferase